LSVIEIIRFRPREGAAEKLLAGRAAMVAALTRRFGMEHSTLCRIDDQIWVDVMRFPSEEAAEEALAHEMELPDFASWVENVDEVLGKERIDVLAA
jgi:hypothetical protein